ASSALDASSRALTLRASRASRSWAMLSNSVWSGVLDIFLLDYRRDKEQAVIVGGRVGHQDIAFGERVRCRRSVVAQAQLDVLMCRQGMGHGLDARGVHCLKLLDKAQDAVQFLLGACAFLWRKLNARKPGDAGYVLVGNCHGFYVREGF